MALWIIEVRNLPGEWEVVAVEAEKEMAQAIQDELEVDQIGDIRARETSDIPVEQADELHTAAWNRTVEQIDRWEPYRWRAIVRLHREGR